MLDFIREHGILGSLFRVIGRLWHYLFRLVIIGAVLRVVWMVLFGERSRRRREEGGERSESSDTEL